MSKAASARLAASLAACALCLALAACSIAVSRGFDPRDSNAPLGTVGTNMGPSNAAGVVAGPMFFDWLKSIFMPNKHSDVPPPPPPSADAKDERSNLEQDCTDPAKHAGKDLRCR